MDYLHLICTFYTLVVVCIWTVHSQTLHTEKGVEIREFCNMETMEAQCGTDEIVVMEVARYGRMRVGRCVSQDYGNIGCSVDVINYTDFRCSGRRHCRIKLPDDTLYRMQVCPKDVTSHLEAGYSCQKVIPNIDHKCNSANPLAGVSLTSQTGVITNSHSSRRCTWNIAIPRGQRINVTLTDFGYVQHMKGNNQRPVVCQKYAIIKDMLTLKDHVVCSGTVRRRSVYVSEGNHLMIQTMGGHPDGSDEPRYVLSYQAVGCPDPEVPKTMHVIRDSGNDGNNAVIYCNATGEKRYHVCENNKWVGELGDCPQTGASTAQSKWNLWAILTHQWTTPYGIIVVIGLGIGLGIIIGVILLVAVLVFFKKRDRRRQRNVENDSYDSSPSLANGGQQIPRTSNELDKKYSSTTRKPSGAFRDTDSGVYSTNTWSGSRYPVIARTGDPICTCTTLARETGQHTCRLRDYDTRDINRMNTLNGTILSRDPEHEYELPH